jgi:hypothetical protein
MTEYKEVNMSKALIEKAFNEYIVKVHPTFRSLGGEVVARMELAFIAGATWQREQLEAEIKEQVIKKAELFVECGKRGEQISDLQAENKTIRQQLIKELREWSKNNIASYGFENDYITVRDLLAKLDDLLEGKK